MDPLREREAECERLRQENEHLRTENKRLVAERDGFYGWYIEQLQEECRKHPEAVEAEILEGMKNGVDFVALVRRQSSRTRRRRNVMPADPSSSYRLSYNEPVREREYRA